LPGEETASRSRLVSRLSAACDWAERSLSLFASPLGPFYQDARHYFLPRFVHFGPHTSDASVRLSLYSGLDHRDTRSAIALLGFIERLSTTPQLGRSLDLTFFPLVDLLGFVARVPGRDLKRADWNSGVSAPEIDLLARDARLRHYHGFVRIETIPESDVVNVSLRTTSESSVVQLLSSDDLVPFDVRWLADVATASSPVGPLALEEDLTVAPFELTLGIPSAWSAEKYSESVAVLLLQFIERYREFAAYAQHL